MPPSITQKRRPPLEPISYDELMSNAGMSGFVSFLIPPLEPAAREVEPPPPAQAPRKGRIRKAATVEDGHSLAEQAVYEALWKAASPMGSEAAQSALASPLAISSLAISPLATGEDRTVRIGYHRLAQMTRLSWVSVKSNLRSLEMKLAIEVTGSENSATREGKCYRVYSGAAILERRNRAGLVWVRRSRGVELLKRELPTARTPKV